MGKRTAIYPGTFDPVTAGHILIIERSLQIFDHIVVGVLKNISKAPLFSLKERQEMIRQSFPDEPRIQVDAFEGLLVEYAQKKGATAIIRGLRGVADFEYELQMCNMNRRLAPDIVTLYLMADERHTYVSSSLIKEVARLGGDVSGLVPEHVEARLKSAFD